MMFVVVGHRGSGKSSFLGRLRRYYREAGRRLLAVDLDRRIEHQRKRPIASIFAGEGESEFRRLERDLLEEVASRSERAPRDVDVCVALGAGHTGPIPPTARCLWIRRATDSVGRVFLDRPRLDPRVSPLAEYLARFAAREARYRTWAHADWIVGEGFDAPNPMERAFVAAFFELAAPPVAVRAVVSLFPPERRWREAFRTFDGWPGVRFEIRDDLFPPADLHAILVEAPLSRVVFAFRRGGRPVPEIVDRVARCGGIDWPVELDGAPPDGIRPTVVSLHDRFPGESIGEAAKRLMRAAGAWKDAVLKLSVEARDFEELESGHRWARSAPRRRAFLPRTPYGEPVPGGFGRWIWYRELVLPESPLPFVRDGEGTSSDQPSWLDALSRWEIGGPARRFAAVLGDPVQHSRTPAEHHRFFASRGMPVVAVAVKAEEWDRALEVLRRLGLRNAAITAPLKLLAFRSAERASRVARELGTVNTLAWNDALACWEGTNTDLAGFRALGGALAPGSGVAVWGGGGTSSMLRRVLPRAKYYSARTGASREGGGALTAGEHPRAVVWASGRQGCLPAAQWRPSKVVDLDYAEDSSGRTYALATGAPYVSGIRMFKVQAREQRRFWKRVERRGTGGGADLESRIDTGDRQE